MTEVNRKIGAKPGSFYPTFLADGEIERFKAVKVNDDYKVEVADSQSDLVIGITYNSKDEDDEWVTVVTWGTAFAIADSDVNAWDELVAASDGDGKLAKRSSDSESYVVGVALTEAGEDEEVIVQIQKYYRPAE